MKRRLQFTHTPATPRPPITQTVQNPQHKDAPDHTEFRRENRAPVDVSCTNDLLRGVWRQLTERGGYAVEYAGLNQVFRLPFAETKLNRWQFTCPNLIEGEAYASIN